MIATSFLIFVLSVQSTTPPDPQTVVANVLIKQIEEAALRGCPALEDAIGALAAYRYLSKLNPNITGEDSLLNYAQTKFGTCPGSASLGQVAASIGGGGGSVKGLKIPPMLLAYSLLLEKDKSLFRTMLPQESRSEFEGLIQVYGQELTRLQNFQLEQQFKIDPQYKLDGLSDYLKQAEFGATTKGAGTRTPSTTTSKPSGRP